jgi:hypothetical protein
MRSASRAGIKPMGAKKVRTSLLGKTLHLIQLPDRLIRISKKSYADPVHERQSKSSAVIRSRIILTSTGSFFLTTLRFSKISKSGGPRWLAAIWAESSN